ncbi:MAG TPA: polysaccharide deacetylase family protein [Solirubrobacteraceae bacterium]
MSRRPISSPDMAVTPERFERHVRGLARLGYIGITTEAWLDHLERGRRLPRKPVIFTFDDGYAETAERALPVLERYGFGAVVFLVTHRVGDTAAWAADAAVAESQLLTEDEVRSWHARGVEFGSHTQTHPDLTSLSTEAALKEIRESRDDLESLLGTRPRSFAYPFGSFDARSVEAVEETYACAFSVRLGLSDFAEDPYRLGRFVVQRDDAAPDLAATFRLGWHPRRRAQRLWAGVAGRAGS